MGRRPGRQGVGSLAQVGRKRPSRSPNTGFLPRLPEVFALGQWLEPETWGAGMGVVVAGFSRPPTRVHLCTHAYTPCGHACIFHTATCDQPTHHVCTPSICAPHTWHKYVRARAEPQSPRPTLVPHGRPASQPPHLGPGECRGAARPLVVHAKEGIDSTEGR